MSFKLRGKIASQEGEFLFEEFDETEFYSLITEISNLGTRVSYQRVFDLEVFDERYFVTDVKVPILEGSVISRTVLTGSVIR